MMSDSAEKIRFEDRPNPEFIKMPDGRQFTIPDEFWRKWSRADDSCLIHEHSWGEGCLRIQLKDGGDLGWWDQTMIPVCEALRESRGAQGIDLMDEWIPERLYWIPGNFIEGQSMCRTPYNPYPLVNHYQDKLEYHRGQVVISKDGRRLIVWPEQCPIDERHVMEKLAHCEANLGIKLRSLDEPEKKVIYAGQEQLSRRNPLWLLRQVQEAEVAAKKKAKAGGTACPVGLYLLRKYPDEIRCWDDPPGQSDTADEPKTIVTESATLSTDVDTDDEGAGSSGSDKEILEADNVFMKMGKIWEFSYDGKQTHLPHKKGFSYIAQLLAQRGIRFRYYDFREYKNLNPNNEAITPPFVEESEATPCLENDSSDKALSYDGSAMQDDTILDARAVAEYRKALHAIKKEREKAVENNDWEKQKELNRQEEFIRGELRRATGLRHTRQFNSNTERARKAISKAITRAIEDIKSQHAALGNHLFDSVKTGYEFIYSPTIPIEWITS